MASQTDSSCMRPPAFVRAQRRRHTLGRARSGQEGRVGEEELKAQGLGLLEDSVGQLSSDDLDRLLRSIPTPEATELVKALIGNKLDPRRVKKPGALLIGPLKKQQAARHGIIVERLSIGDLGSFEQQLGDRYENLTR